MKSQSIKCPICGSINIQYNASTYSNITICTCKYCQYGWEEKSQKTKSPLQYDKNGYINNNSDNQLHCTQSFKPKSNSTNGLKIILWLIFLFPIGLYFLWTSEWSKKTKWIITGITVFLVIAFIATNDTNPSTNNINNIEKSTLEKTIPALTKKQERAIRRIIFKTGIETIDNIEYAKHLNNGDREYYVISTGIDDKENIILRLNKESGEYL